MLFLYVFGAMAEERMGRFAYALFYLGTGYLALAGYAAAHAHSEQTLVGASGAISGVLGAFLFLFPRSRVTSLFPFLFFLPLRFPPGSCSSSGSRSSGWPRGRRARGPASPIWPTSWASRSASSTPGCATGVGIE